MSDRSTSYALGKGTFLLHKPLLGEESVYTIEDVLGQGGFGITYLASSTISKGKNIKFKVFFAIKEFFVKGQCYREANDPQMRYSPAAKKEIEDCKKDFLDEANRLNRICSKNPNIVNVNEVFEANNTAYYVMEHLSGGSLRDIVLGSGPMLERDALLFVLPVARAVEYIHQEYKLLHCDVSPDNIMLRVSDDGIIPVLIDFGESLHFNSKGDLTTTRNAVGAKEGYAPPEQYQGVKSFDPRIDVYALSATLFYLLTGHRPIAAFDISRDYIEKNLPVELSASVRDAILHGMERDKHNRTKTVAEFIKEIEGAEIPDSGQPDELPIGYILRHGGKGFQIVSKGQKQVCSIKYKAERNVTTDEHGGITTKTTRAPYDIYEFFVDGCHHRNDDMSVSTYGDTSNAWQQYLSLCNEKTSNAFGNQFQTSYGDGWTTFEANNTYYLVRSKVSKTLPWKRIISYSAAGIGSLLLIYNAVNLFQRMEIAQERKRVEMSQQLTEAIASNDAKVLREFAITHDSTRAYMPYAQICLDQENFDTADTIAEKMVAKKDSTLWSIIHQKRDSIAQAAQQIAEEHVFDSLFSAANSQYNDSQYDAAKKTVAQMDDEYRSRQEVQLLLSRIEVAIAKDLSEARFDSLYKVAQSQFDNNQFNTAKETLAKIDNDHLSRQKVKDLLKAIEKAITPTDDEVFQQALRKKDWSTIERLANKGYSKAYYQLAKWYVSKKNYTNAKKWANKAVNAGVSVTESKKIINIVVKEENFRTGSELYQQWVNSGDSITREKAIQSLQNADQNNQLIKNMLNELKKKRKPNYILH